MILECPYCEVNVEATVVNDVHFHLPEFEGNPPLPDDRLERLVEIQKRLGLPDGVATEYRVTLVQCPKCKIPMLASEVYVEGEDPPEQSYPERVWPSPQRWLDFPGEIRASLVEAQACLKCGAYRASVVMTGRALEAVAKHFDTEGETGKLMLGRGLDQLHKSAVIDHRLYEWGKELQQNRNLAAHATNAVFDRQDAVDLLDFGIAICEYVFVLTERFDGFKKRRADRT